MTGTKVVYYWDTCIFLAWLKNETTRKPGEMDSIAALVEKFKKREVSIITSVLTLTEMGTAKVPAGTQPMLDDLMQRSNFTRLAVDIRVAKLARELRDYYTERPDDYKGRTLSVPDAIHVATAIIYRATEMHTFDGKDDPKQLFLGLLPLSGDVAGNTLIICKPPIPMQSSLPGFAGLG